jgi:hypothetical protein
VPATSFALSVAARHAEVQERRHLNGFVECNVTKQFIQTLMRKAQLHVVHRQFMQRPKAATANRNKPYRNKPCRKAPPPL